MCQTIIYLDGTEIMQDVTLVEILPESVVLNVFFEAPVVVPAALRKVDLLKHLVISESIRKGETGYERNGEIASAHPALDRT
jgi:predicted RNA-binding protein